MARVQYHSARNDRPGYWETRKPGLDNIEELFDKSQGVLSRDDTYRIIIQGKPCKRSPEWDEYHPEEAAKGVATYSYAVDRDTIEYDIEDTELALRGEIFNTFVDQMAAEAVTFANLLIVQSNTKRCWTRIDFIHVVDTR